MSSDFKTALELLNRYSVRHKVDIHLTHHVYELGRRIRDSALVMYFKPFKAIRLAGAFGWSVQEVEKAGLLGRFPVLGSAGIEFVELDFSPRKRCSKLRGSDGDALRLGR